MALEIVGAGFGRTGTKSLKIALERLGYGPCHHMDEIGANLDLLPDWVSAAEGNKMNWEKVFTNFKSQVDWPGARYWKDIANFYPKSKVILTTRDPVSWHNSIMQTIANSFQNRKMIKSQSRKALVDMAFNTVNLQIFDGNIEDPRIAIGVFNRHIHEVRAAIPAKRLLVFDVDEGWEPLCSFLNAPVPSGLFPHHNISTDFQNRLRL